MLETYVNEFIAITTFLLKAGQQKKIKGFLIVEKSVIETMLDKNKYDTSGNKLRIWKGLNWIDADEDRLTKRIYEKKKNSYIPYVKICLKVFETLKKVNGK